MTLDVRAATMTFAVYFDDASVADWVRDRTRAVAAKHPSRVLLLDATRPRDDHPAIPPESADWIEVGVKGSTSHDITASVSTLRLPEAPVVLAWIAASVAEDERFATLAASVDTAIVSSSVIHTDASGVRDLSALLEKHPELAVRDIAYLRLGTWQELVAEFFDEPEFMEELEALRHVSVTCGSDAEMYYLLGWLASRLEWSPCNGREFCNGAGDTIAFEMHREGPPRRLSRIELNSRDVTFTAVVPERDENAVCLTVSGAKERDERCSPLHTLDIATLVERAILGTGRDDVFLESLAMARRMLDA